MEKNLSEEMVYVVNRLGKHLQAIDFSTNKTTYNSLHTAHQFWRGREKESACVCVCETKTK